MKRKLISYFLLISLLIGIAPTSVFAADIVASGTCGVMGNESSLTWVLDSDGVLTISGTGEMRDYGYSSMGGTAPWNNEDNPYGSQIKQVIVESGVTKIGWCAFLGCYNLHSIKLSDTVTKFDGGALFGGEWTYGASSLVNIDIDPNNQVYTSVDGVVFTKDMTTLVSFPAKKSDGTYEIPESVTEIAPYAFVYSTLQGLDIPDSVNKIGDFAFSDCGELTSITIPESVTEVGAYAFNYCWNLSDISLPNRTAVIPDGMFYGCYDLNEITIPTSVKSIGWGAFKACTALRHVYYSGSEEDWNKISIEDANDPLLSANIHFQETQPESAIVGFYPADNTQVDRLEQSMIRIEFDRDVLSGQVKHNYADLDFTKAPLSLYRASDDALIYQVTEYEDDGISFDVTSFSSSPTEVNICIINAESLLTPGESYYVTMGEGFIRFADGTVSPEIKKGNWAFSLFFKKKATIQMNTGAGSQSTGISTTWDEAWFAKDSTTYMHELAITSMVLSGAAYNEHSIKSALQNLGFNGVGANEVVTQNYDYPLTETDNDIVAYALGQKIVYDEIGNPYTLIAIVIKGTSGNEEWYSNFNVGTGSTHSGFQIASEELLAQLDDFRKMIGADNKNIKYLVTGHSRGAAVANLVAAELTKSGLTKKENIYAYTFATPMVSTLAAEDGYQNIFNIISGEDFVTRVPLNEWNYKRYGIDLMLPSRSYYSSDYYNYIYLNMQTQFSAITGHGFSGFNGTNDVDCAISAMYSLAPSVDAYYNKYYLAANGLPFATTYDYFRNLAELLGEGLSFSQLPLLGSASFQRLTAFFVVHEKVYEQVFSAHCQATYYSWLKTCSAKDLFGPYNTSTKDTFKRLTVACPVNVYVYNESGTLVSSIVSESVETNILATNLSDGVKTIDLPGDQTYSIKIVAYDSGTVDYTIEELSATATGTDVLRTVEFYKIPIETSDELTGMIDEAHSIESSQYALTKNDQDRIYVDYDSAQQESSSSGGSSSNTTKYTIKQTEGIAGGSIHISKTKGAKGEDIEITAHPDEDYELDSLSVTTDSGVSIELTLTALGRYTFTMPASNVTVDATFVPAKENGSVDAFLDIEPAAWYYNAVKYAIENGIMSGTGSNQFAPNISLSRAMIAQILYNLEKRPGGGEISFTDVIDGQWYTEAVTWAANNGIVSGYGNDTFGPNDAVTREQLAVILYRYAQYKGYNTTISQDLSVFADGNSASGWAVEALEWAVSQGVMAGKGGNILDPIGTATRAEVAQMFFNYLTSL